VSRPPKFRDREPSQVVAGLAQGLQGVLVAAVWQSPRTTAPGPTAGRCAPGGHGILNLAANASRAWRKTSCWPEGSDSAPGGMR